MRKRFFRRVMCLALAILLVVGLMPGIAMTVHANTTITEISVNDIAVPEIGETPEYTASVPEGVSYYIGTDIAGLNSDVNGILWVNNGSTPMKSDAAFAEDGSYDVRMEIYANDGFVFAAKENLNVTINGQSAHVISRTDKMIYIRYTFGAPVQKEETGCNGTDHNFEKVLVPATTWEDGKIYEICTKGCDTVRNETVIPRIKTVKISKEYYVYDGNAKKPTVTVKDRTGKTLVKDEDYTVIYPTNSKKVGLYVVDVVLKGNYEGLESLNFQILPAVKTTKLSFSSTVYNGKTKSPSVTVKDSTGTKLVKNTDYTVTVPKGRTAIGKYTYTIKFKGKYAGVKAKKLTLTIKPAKPTIQTPTAAKKAITVKWKKAAKAQTTGYQVMTATDSAFKKNVKKAFVTGYSKTSYKMTNLKAKNKYYVRVRTYKTVNGEKIYSDWSKVKTIKTL